MVGIACVTDEHELLMVTEQGQIIRMPTTGLRPIGRDTQGVRLIDLADDDRVVSIATLLDIEGEDPDGEAVDSDANEASEDGDDNGPSDD